MPAATPTIPADTDRNFDGLMLGLLVWMFLACCFPLYDTDLFWHLKTGELILQTFSIPGYDTYTYTDYGKRWIDLHWGFQVGAALLYNIGGANLLIVVKAAILAAALGIAYLASGKGLPSWLRVLCWILPAITISGRGFERPEVITLLCLACWLWILPRLDRRPRLIWLLPALQILWINCHALFVLGLIVGACYAIDYFARYWFGGRFGLGPRAEQLTPTVFLIAAGLCGLAAFVNPYLEEGALFPLTLFRKFTVEQDFYSIRIGEFQQPIRFLLKHGFINLYLNAEIALWIAAALSFVWLAARRQVNIFRTLIFVAFSYLAWKASRNTNVFSIVAGFVLTANIGDCVWSAASRHDGEETESHIARWMRFLVGLLLATMCFAVVTDLWNQSTEKIRPFGVGETNAWFAHDAAKFMRQPGFPDRVFASNFGIASIYTYYNHPTGRVFMDGRLEVCTKATFKRFDDISSRMVQADTGWMSLARDEVGRLPAVMLDTRGSRPMIVGMINTPGWRLVFADKSCAVFFPESVAERLKLPVADMEPLVIPPQP